MTEDQFGANTKFILHFFSLYKFLSSKLSQGPMNIFWHQLKRIKIEKRFRSKRNFHYFESRWKNHGDSYSTLCIHLVLISFTFKNLTFLSVVPTFLFFKFVVLFKIPFFRLCHIFCRKATEPEGLTYSEFFCNIGSNFSVRFGSIDPQFDCSNI